MKQMIDRIMNQIEMKAIEHEHGKVLIYKITKNSILEILTEMLTPFTEHSDPNMDALYCADPSRCKDIPDLDEIFKECESKAYTYRGTTPSDSYKFVPIARIKQILKNHGLKETE